MMFRRAGWYGPLMLMLLLLAGMGSLRADWRDELSPPQPGEFPPLRPVHLQYQCGWAGVTAGHVAASLTHPTADICELEVVGSTTGLARTLWPLDATHFAKGNLRTLRPISVRQREVYRSQTIRTALDFDATGVNRLRVSTNEQNPAKRKHFDFPNLFDLQTALLYVRSQKLEDGAVYRMIVYPASAPYLATVTILGREHIKVKAGSYPAIKMDLKLQKVMGDMTLAPHGKYKRGTAWISDDADRLPLRMNAQIFVGSVWVELAKVD